MTALCRHGRPSPCAYCLAKIPPHHFYEMMRWLNELRRQGKRRAA